MGDALIPFKCGDTASYHLHDAEGFKQVDKAVYLCRLACKLQHYTVGVDINGFCTIEICYLDYLVEILNRASCAYEDMLSAYGIVKYADLLHLIELQKLIFDLLKYLAVARYNYRHAGDIGGFCFCYIEALDIEKSSAEEACHAQQHTIVIGNLDG